MSKEFSQQQEQQQRQEAQAASGESKQKRCSHCGTVLEEDELFCPECGEKYGGEERECPICKTRTTSDFCPHCGYKITALICPKCGAQSHYDFCENCGTVLNASLQEFFEKKHEPVQVEVSAERAAEIKKSFEKSKTPELRSFLQKIEEHRILLEERDYFKNREKRIVKVLGANPFDIELPDPEEEAFKMKAYAALEKTVIEREKKATKEMLEKMFPTLEKDMAEAEENERKQAKAAAALQNEYEAVMKEVENAVAAAEKAEKKRIAEAERLEAERLRAEAERKRQEAERKRKEAERLAREKAEAEEKKRQAEIRKRKLEQERKKAEMLAEQRKALGTYTGTNGISTWYITVESVDGGVLTGTCRNEHPHLNAESEGVINGWISGNTFEFTETVIWENYDYTGGNRENSASWAYTFHADFNSDKTVFSGYWFSPGYFTGSSATFYKY